MAITTKLELRQSQQLVMTPQLQQAIKLLQLSNLELNEFVDAELERNPLLERDEDHDPAGSLAESASERDSDADSDLGDGGDFDDGDGTSGGRLDLIADTTAPASDLDADRDIAFAEESPQDIAALLAGSAWSGARQSGSMSGEEADLESILTSEISLRDHLASQLQLAVHDPVERMIGSYLIDLVDDAGYLRADLSELADRLGA
ncbi:MAG: RNA polymerase sigma-54 factor, partial [Hyphomicrobiaceae bacterium]